MNRKFVILAVLVVSLLAFVAGTLTLGTPSTPQVRVRSASADATTLPTDTTTTSVPDSTTTTLMIAQPTPTVAPRQPNHMTDMTVVEPITTVTTVTQQPTKQTAPAPAVSAPVTDAPVDHGPPVRNVGVAYAPIGVTWPQIDIYTKTAGGVDYLSTLPGFACFVVGTDADGNGAYVPCGSDTSGITNAFTAYFNADRPPVQHQPGYHTYQMGFAADGALVGVDIG